MRADPITRGKHGRVGRFVCAICGSLGLLLAGAASAAPPPKPPLQAFQTKASPSVTVGAGSIHDQAQLFGDTSLLVTGTVTFKLYGPDDPNCAKGAIRTDTVTLTGKGLTADSPPFTPTAPGSYQYVASYAGGNFADKASKCGEASETVQVTVVTPTVTTQASPSVPAGTQFTDSATINGGMNPTGTIVFQVYGPGDVTCSHAIGGSKVTITDPTQPTISGPFRPSTPGTYQFLAFYSGDAANGAAQSTCGDPAENVVVTPAPPPGPSPPSGGSGPGSGSGSGGGAGASQPGCDVAGTARAVLAALAATLTGGPGSGFRSTCSAGLRIVLRAKELRPGNKGYPSHNGFTTMANTLTHVTPTGPALTFSLNANGVALRNYALNNAQSLTAFLVVHVRRDKTAVSTEALQVLTLG